MGWGVFKPAGDEGDGGDGGKAADDIELNKKVNQVSKLTGKPSQDNKARGLLADIDRLIEKGQSKGKGK